MTDSNTNNSGILVERLKFYADTPLQSNKYFCWKIERTAIKTCLWRFWDRGWNIRAAYYEMINTETGEILRNVKMPLQEMLIEYQGHKFDFPTKHQVK